MNTQAGMLNDEEFAALQAEETLVTARINAGVKDEKELAALINLQRSIGLVIDADYLARADQENLAK